MCRHGLSVEAGSGGIDDNTGLEIEPGNPGRVGLVEDRDAPTLEQERVLCSPHLACKGAVNGIPGQEVGELWSRSQIVDSQQFEPWSVYQGAQ
jgi:hypothetical protein